MGSQFKLFFKQISLYGLFNIIGKAGGFLMLPIYTRYLAPEHYGTLELIEITASIFELVAGAGIAYAVFKYYHKYEDEHNKRRVISTAMHAVLGFHTILAAVALAFSDYLSVLIFKDTGYQYFLILIFCRIIMSGAIHFGVDYLRVTDSLRSYGVYYVGRFALAILFNIIFLVGYDMGVEGVLWSSILSTFLIGLPLVIQVYSGVGLGFDMQKLMPMLRYGTPFIGVLIGQFVINTADRFFLQRFVSLADVGIYSLGYKFGFMVNFLIVSPFLLMWETKLFEIFKQEDPKPVYARMLTYFVFALVATALALSVFTREILHAMATPAYFGAAIVVPLIAMAYVCNGLQEFFRMGMMLKSRTGIVGAVMAAQCVVAVGLYWLFIPRWGAAGASLAVFATYFGVFAANFFYSQSLYPVKFENMRLLKIVLVGIAMYALSTLVPEMGFLPSLLVKMPIFLAFFIVLLATGFLDKREKEVLQQKIGGMLGGRSGALFWRGRFRRKRL